MSGEGHLRELERMLDEAMRKFQTRKRDMDNSSIAATAYHHGITVGLSRAIALIGNTQPSNEWTESTRRIGLGL